MHKCVVGFQFPWGFGGPRDSGLSTGKSADIGTKDKPVGGGFCALQFGR